MKPTLKEVRELMSKHKMFFGQGDENLILFSYRYCDPTIYNDGRWGRIAEEVRGIIFDKKSGEIVARPLPKFFNLHEPQCRVSHDDTATTTLKLDGSLVIAFMYNGEVRYASKGSLNSWVTKRAAEIATRRHERLVEDSCDMTVCYELLDPENPVVIGYREPQLTLIAIRDNDTGKVLPPQELIEVGRQYDIPVAEVVHRDMPVRRIAEEVLGYSDVEGVVGYTDDGRLFKQKARWYIFAHSALSNKDDERLARLYLNGELDDVYGILPDTVRERVDEVVAEVNSGMDVFVEALESVDRETPRREFAEWVLDNVPKPMQGAFFKVHSGADPREIATRTVRMLAERKMALRMLRRFKKRWER